MRSFKNGLRLISVSILLAGAADVFGAGGSEAGKTDASADVYPEAPVELIVAYSPGGGTDTAARIVGQYAQEYVTQNLVITNKPGAGGQLGFTALAREKNDGYTIGFINVPSIFLIKLLRDNVPYELSDFEPIANIQLDPVVLAVNADSPFQTLEDFIEAARENPGKVNVGGDGPQSNNQLQLLAAENLLDIKLNFISFDGSSPAIAATLGNQVDASVPSATSAANSVREGRLRVLAVFSDAPYAYLPDVPTISAASGINIPSVGASLRGIVAPAGIPPERKAFLVEAFAKTMEDPAFLAYAEENSLPLKYMNPEEFTDYLRNAEQAIGDYIDLLK